MKPHQILQLTLLLSVWLSAGADAAPQVGLPWERIAQAIELTPDQVHTLQSVETAMLHEIHRVETEFRAGTLDREEAHELIQAARETLEIAWGERFPSGVV